MQFFMNLPHITFYESHSAFDDLLHAPGPNDILTTVSRRCERLRRDKSMIIHKDLVGNLQAGSSVPSSLPTLRSLTTGNSDVTYL
jgi:hypothetical protein